MSYSCPDCKDGELTTEVRPVGLREGETVHILDDGTAVITNIGCSNEDCSSHNENGEEEQEEEKPKRKKRAPAAVGPCEKEGCIRPAGHPGSHYRKVEK